jgi:hypothetical protein
MPYQTKPAQSDRRSNSLRWIILFVGTGAIVAASSFGSIGWSAVPAGASDAAADIARRPPKYQGSGDCGKCHTMPTADEIADGTTKSFDLTEVTTWAEKDKHALAFKVLNDSRSQRMGQLLGIKPASDASCLSCHAVAVDASQCAEGSPIRVQQKGVSCEACHGPASEWIDDHWHPNKWRKKLTREEKTAKGLADLRDDATRGAVCLSCHLGDARQGKVVTHDMFAAGHPPISGFEIETFARAMPKHWKPASQQPPEIRAQYADQRDPNKPEPMASTRTMTIGGLTAMAAYARLVRDNAQARAQARRNAGTEKASSADFHGAELAFYDCQACHHELTVDSWRQKRGYPGRPGRPAVRAWPIALGKIAAAACGDRGKPLLDSLEPFYRAIDKQPFGAPEELAASAEQLAGKAEEAIAFLKTQRFDEGRGLAILKEICARGTSEIPDFETARQLGWTSRIVYDELPGKFHSKELDEVFEALQTELALTLPLREQEVSQGAGAAADDWTCVANKSVPQTLAAAARYNPRALQDHFKKLEQLLAALPK